MFLPTKNRKILKLVFGFRKMNNRFNLFALLACSVLMIVLFFQLATNKELPESGIQALSFDKQKRQRPTPEEPEAQAMPWANKLEGCTITFYDICVECCGKTDGITYSGAQAVPYETCATDPAVIPLGSAVTVDYGDGALHHYRAEDVGGGVKGNHIDICVASHEEALSLGRRTATVYWMETEVLG